MAALICARRARCVRYWMTLTACSWRGLLTVIWHAETGRTWLLLAFRSQFFADAVPVAAPLPRRCQFPCRLPLHMCPRRGGAGSAADPYLGEFRAISAAPTLFPPPLPTRFRPLVVPWRRRARGHAVRLVDIHDDMTTNECEQFRFTYGCARQKAVSHVNRRSPTFLTDIRGPYRGCGGVLAGSLDPHPASPHAPAGAYRENTAFLAD